MYERNDFAEPMSDQHPELPCFCGNREMIGDGSGARKLPTNRPKIWFHSSFKLPGVERERAIAAVMRGANRWSTVADIEFSRTEDINEATIAIFGVKLDGPSGVLADMQLWFGQKFPLQGRFDISERRWCVEDEGETDGVPIEAVSAHEIGHAISFEHWPASPPPELMEPRLSDVRYPQPTEGAVAAKLYGQPKPKAEPATPPTAGVSELTTKFKGDGWLEISFVEGGKRREAKGQAKVVT